MRRSISHKSWKTVTQKHVNSMKRVVMNIDKRIIQFLKIDATRQVNI